MATDNYYSSLINQIRSRSVESTVSMLGITDKNLRKHLVERLSDQRAGTSFLADPVFEVTFPWEKQEKRMESFAGNLLNESLVKAMDEAGDHKFGKDWFPFKHQVNAWETLLDDSQKNSVVVTSGTGSGKTECFMVPILNDLANEYQELGEPLVGTRALFIYPLNALINSQRERLRAWTHAFDDGVRFSLYNGNTEHIKHKDQGKVSNELLTRKNIRETPPPIMVTNATMLEYMLVRQLDEPIIEQSKGKLRWIVLDEAHTYIGSQAAELSLLLRRVLHTFGVEAKNVRFVATSATIGDKEAEQKLQEYLANLAGVDIQRVHIVGGKRETPNLEQGEKNNDDSQALKAIDSGKSFSASRYVKLSGNQSALKLRDSLIQKGQPATLPELAKDVYGDSSSDRQNTLLELLDTASFTVKPGPVGNKPDIDSEPFLPVRSHLFHQVMSGLWCCSDKNCSHKKETPLAEKWPFGYVYAQRRAKCECGAPIYELVFCLDCNTPHLMGVQTKGGNIIQYDRNGIDEFSLDYDVPDDEGDASDTTDSAALDTVFLAPTQDDDKTHPISIDPETLSVGGMGVETIDLLQLNDKSQCSCCGYERKPYPFRQSLLGTPFYISNTVPTLLEACSDGEKPLELPSRGRRLITFTDSRQGTARISTKIQQDSERDSVRGQVYRQAVANTFSSDVPNELREKLLDVNSKIESYADNAELLSYFTNEQSEITKAIKESTSSKPIFWDDMVTKLESHIDIKRWMFDYYSDLNPEIFDKSSGPKTLAQMILLREFARRPKRHNSLETLGLVAICYPSLERIKEVPKEWEALKFDLNDWLNFLTVALDFYVRENTILDIPDGWSRWMGAKVFPKTVLNPMNPEGTSNSIKKWPQVFGKRSNRLIRLIEAAAGLDIADKYNIDLINNILKAAWTALTSKTKILKEADNSKFQLQRNEIAFKVVDEAWVCPITNRIIATTFKGLTPYLPFNTTNTNINCRPVSVPVCNIDTSEAISSKNKIEMLRGWIEGSPEVAELREENLWTDISDRIVEGKPFHRSAEHSAQQPASRLQNYEHLFKQGKLNVLSCSTTMEMGVDIGGISVVAMNNVPPHPANYLQRAGRAGRRGETQAVAFTICKDNPHERGVFQNPVWPFITSIPAPYIVLNSAQIVQRHVNSLLAAHFFKKVVVLDQSKSVITLNCGWFFIDVEGQPAPYKRMRDWLKSLSQTGIPDNLNAGIRSTVKGSVLSSKSSESLCSDALDSLEVLGENWVPRYNELKIEVDSLSKVNDRDPFKRKLEYDLRRFEKDYLLSEMASQSFLPGYGFPTGIATFDNYSVHEFKKKNLTSSGKAERIDNLTRMRERPGRNLSVAIREYAPGADVVLDGLVYKSAGVLLNSLSPDGDYNEPVKLSHEWRCHKCGSIGQAFSVSHNQNCLECGEELEQKNIKEFIEPKGFSVDFYSEPSNDISSQQYIPVEEPWVTSNSKLCPLFNPLLGSYRNSSQGHIFHYSSGVNGTGYALCLKCGKAESMTIDGDYPETLQPKKAHKRLRGRPDKEESNVCKGSDEAFALKGGLHLGTSDQTDVFELYLKNVETGDYYPHQRNDSLSWTIAVSLRQALSDIHGINADEIGYTVKPTALPGCENATGIALYDRCGGGAGFSSAAPHYIQRLLLEAKKYLECPDECGSACQSCLLGYDTRFHVNVLDRFVAKAYFESIANLVVVPDELKLFGDATKVCIETLDSEISRHADSGYNSLDVFLHSHIDEWNLLGAALRPRTISWLNMFESVKFILPSKLDFSDNSEVRDELLILQHLGVELETLDTQAKELVRLESNDDSMSFATRNSKSGIPNDDFWNFESYSLVRGRSQPRTESKSFVVEAPQQLLVQQGDVEVEITRECDTRVSLFGKKLWDILTAKSEKLAELVEAAPEIKSISYSDPYISSPWTLMLFSEIISGLKRVLKANWNNPVINLTTGDRDPNPRLRGIIGEWQDQSTQREVAEQVFEYMGEELSLTFEKIKSMPHGRALVIAWETGDTTTVRFDHGMGFWKVESTSRMWFEHDSSVEDQVSSIDAGVKVLSTQQGRDFPTQIFIKHR